MKFIGDGLGKQEKANWGNLWDCIKSTVERDILLLYWWIYMINNDHLQHIQVVCTRIK